MKYVLLLLWISFLASCSPMVDSACLERNKELIRVYAHADIDTIISSEHFDYNPKYAWFITELKDLGSEAISISIVGMDDTLDYSLEVKNEKNIIIIVDTSDTPCAADSILTRRGQDLYRVDGKSMHSCVFYLDIRPGPRARRPSPTTRTGACFRRATPRPGWTTCTAPDHFDYGLFYGTCWQYVRCDEWHARWKHGLV